MMEESRKGKTTRSGLESSTFEADVSIHVERKVGSASISPSGRDIALASFVYSSYTLPSRVLMIAIAPMDSMLSISILR